MKKSYIPSPDYLTSIYSNPQLHGRWVVVTKIPIKKIKVDQSLFSFQNEVNWNAVEYITENFELGAWFPIFVNPDFFLLDGQHRLAAAQKMKLKYIDVVVDNGE
jgi:ParB-like nuclease domain